MTFLEFRMYKHLQFKRDRYIVFICALSYNHFLLLREVRSMWKDPNFKKTSSRIDVRIIEALHLRIEIYTKRKQSEEIGFGRLVRTWHAKVVDEDVEFTKKMEDELMSIYGSGACWISDESSLKKLKDQTLKKTL
jgi:hypothetical protein